QLVDANVALQATYSVAQTGGPGLGGLLVDLLSAPTALAADAVSYVVSIGTLASIRTRGRPPEVARSSQRMVRQVVDGFELAFRDRHLRPIFLESAWFNAFEQAVLVLFLV